MSPPHFVVGQPGRWIASAIAHPALRVGTVLDHLPHANGHVFTCCVYDAIERFIITTRTSSIVNFCGCSYGSAKMASPRCSEAPCPTIGFLSCPSVLQQRR